MLRLAHTLIFLLWSTDILHSLTKSASIILRQSKHRYIEITPNYEQLLHTYIRWFLLVPRIIQDLIALTGRLGLFLFSCNLSMNSIRKNRGKLICQDSLRVFSLSALILKSKDLTSI